MASWHEDKLWADAYLPIIQKTVKSIAGKIITIEEASPDEDIKFATDYRLVSVDGGSIGCRIRNGSKFFIQYHDLTIRSSRPSGVLTELDKIRSGFPKWYFYGWADGSTMPYWIFIDMDKFRSPSVIDNPRSSNVPNWDGSSTFNGYDVFDLFLNKCIIGMSKEVKFFLKDRRQMRITGQIYGTMLKKAHFFRCGMN